MRGAVGLRAMWLHVVQWRHSEPAVIFVSGNLMTASVTVPPICTGSETRLSQRIVVDGVVQGVGFRPFVYRLATELGVGGSVRNDGARVIIEASAPQQALERFRMRLMSEAPPLAHVERVTVQIAEPLLPPEHFTIGDSSAGADANGTAVRLTPDAGICERCEAELMDRGNRRHRHVFISCTDCGPRWSMLEALPYDRVRTSMQRLPLCAACAGEYDDPADRRYHAESICCPHCGPSLYAVAPHGNVRARGEDAIAAAVGVLRQGGIVALHGIGGFHLAADATSEHAVRLLRQRKHRPFKPLAVMVRTIEEAEALVELSPESASLLRRAERPVVIAPARSGNSLAPSVAPGLVEIGVMLPSTALHHLLLHDTGVPLVMTSGNASGEPLAATPKEGWRDLRHIADLLLMHDRAVVAPSDDTVLRQTESSVVLMRRARGWSPAPHRMPVATPQCVLGMGGDLKATVALAQGDYAWLSPHLGDQSSLGVQERTAAAIERFVALSGCTPEVVACDAHPGYASTALVQRWADGITAPPWSARAAGAQFVVHRIQHHHAHVAAVLAEHGVTRPVVALAYDGAGCGTDGTIWGGEVLLADLTSFKRVGALASAPLIGGDLAAREPWRAALGWLHDRHGAARAMATVGVPEAHATLASRLAVRSGVVHTSSMGRLFDAAAAVLHVATVNSYEGEAAARLEASAGRIGAQAGTPFPWIESVNGGAWCFDPRSALERLAERKQAGAAVNELAAAWHDDVAATSVRAALRAVDEHATLLGRSRTVVLCGGVFQNVRLLQAVRYELAARGLTVLYARTLPSNDGAIAIGQVAIAAATTALAGGIT